MLHITLKSIYMTKKLTPEVILPLLGANRVKRKVSVLFKMCSYTIILCEEEKCEMTE